MWERIQLRRQTSQFVTEQAEQALSGCINLPIITVYDYTLSFTGFGGIIGINFVLSYTGVGGGIYIAETHDDVSCENEDLSWANNAFHKYRENYIASTNILIFMRDHQSGTLWSVELPSGQSAVYKIAQPNASSALSPGYRSCN